ncbi:hypothetical protein [Amycolatopsis pigmentata]|uniref:Ternary complex associated domain-containing protein n=1 Tax=Amycolatopsis pigmentata TaxID=450801 RepID=A0ABW5FNL1_9PSEU
MAGPEVTFGDVDLDEQRRADVRGALRRIRSDSVSGAWPSRVDHIEVTGVLAGGRSGALVLDIVVYSGSVRLARVAKIDSPAELAAEWRSYLALVKPDATIFFAPIVAATEDVVTPPDAGWGPGAVVYDHATQFTGGRGEPPRSLEDVVRAARTGSAEDLDHVLRIIQKLLRGAASVLYDRHAEREEYPSTLRPMNLALGPNVVLSVDEHDPLPGSAPRLPDDVLLSRTVGGPRTAQLVAGENIVLANLRPDPRGRPGFARGDHIDVAIRPADARTRPPVFAVRGQVVQTRGAAVRARMVAALEELGPVATSDDGWVVAGTEMDCPFGMVLDVLTRPARGRVRSVVHGDLNPRNILLVEDQPILIDYAHTAAGQPQQADFCWLEIGLLREVFADLDFPALLALQRWLALASRVLDHAPEADAVSVLTTVVARRAPELAMPFQVLLAVRRCGRPPRPVWAGLPWHQDYLEQSLLAAHRAAKWADEDQTPARLRATVAVAAVATEHLGGADGFARWTDADLAAAIAGVAPVLRFTDDGAIRLVRDLAVAMSTVDGATEAVLTDVRERVVRTRCAERVRSLLVAWTGHDEYVALTANRASDAAEVFSHIAAEPAAVLCGASGSGKSTVLCEACYRLAVAVLDLPTFDADDPGSLAVRVPVPVDAERLAGLCAADDDPITVAAAVLAGSGLDGAVEPALVLGVPYFLIDDVDRLGSDARRSVLSWLSGLRRRYPRVRVLAVQRQPDQPPEFASAVLWLRDLDVAGMRALLHGALAGTTVRGTTIERLLRILLTEPEWQQVHPRRPGVLALVARAVHRSGVPDGAFAPGDILAEQWLGTGTAGAPKAEDLALVCERIAVRSIEERADTVPLKSRSWPGIPDPDSLLDHLAGRDVLRCSDGEVGFPDQTHRDYFAACALRRKLPAAPVDLVRRLSWHSALRVFVTLPGVADAREVVLDLVRAACRTAPKLAAQLINDARVDDDIVAPFVASCREVLTSDYSVAHEIAEASDALGALAGTAGLDALRSVVTDAACRPDIRAAALHAVAAHLRRSALGGRRWAGGIARLLAEPCPVPLRVAALEVIAADGLRGLELYVGRCITPTEPWPVVRAAVTTLRALGIALPEPLTDVVQVACRRRLADVDQALSGPIVPGEASEYRTERAELLAMLSGPDAVATLLAHRFDFLAGHRPAAALDDVSRLDPPPEPRPEYWDILVGDTTPEVWVRTAVAGEPLDAAAAAHRLLRDTPDQAVRVLTRIDATAPTSRVLIASDMLRAAGTGGLDHAESLFRELMDTVDEDRLTGAAAVLCAICSVRPESGVRLAWSTAGLLAERDLAARHRWPWVAALTRCRGDAAVLSNLIEAGDDTAVLAETALASRDFPRHCHTGPALSFGRAARQRLLDRAPAEGGADWEAARWALAAANMDLVEALPTLRAVATRMAGAPAVATIGTVHSGQISWAPLADVLAVLGYLARRAFDLRATVHVDREPDEVHRLVSDLETREAHHSVRTGRAVALAYLGDCVPLVHAIVADPSLYELGRNALAAWAPYPHTPRSLRTEVALAEWLAGLRDRPALPAGARRALTRLTHEAELRSGVLFPQGEPDTSGKSHEHMC